MSKKQNGDKNFSSYMSSAFQNSMVTGLPQIAGAGNIPKKIVRTFVFVLCVAGFIYQSLTFMNLYWEYHTIVDVQVKSPSVAEMPSITLCNRNGLVMSKICELMPEFCYDPVEGGFEDEFCRCDPRYCKDGKLPGNFSVASEHKVVPLLYKPQKEIQHLLLESEKMIRSCNLFMMYKRKYLVECNLDYLISVKARAPTMRRNVCYTLFSLVGKPTAEPEQVLSYGYLTLDLNSHPLEYITNIPDVSMQVSFHDPRSLSNPYIDGVRMDQAKSYTFVLRKVVKMLLPPPYETGCTDYIEKWKERGGQGSITEEACVQECMVTAALQVYGCVPDGFVYPTNERVCGQNINETLMDTAEECMKSCKPACLHVTYEATMGENPYGHKHCAESTEMGRMFVFARFESMQTTTYIYQPKYEEIEMFSYIGGYVGMWLGISLVALFDFVETVVMLLKFPLRSMLQCRRGSRTRVRKTVKVRHY